MPDPLDALRQKCETSRPMQCAVGLLLRDHPDQTDLITRASAAAADPEDTMTFAGISSWLEEQGHKVGREALSKHHYARCKCR